MNGDAPPLAKLHPPQFREAVAQGRVGSLAVLVEIEGGGPSIEFDSDAIQKGFGSPRPFRIAPAVSPAGATAAVRAAIEEIVGVPAASPYGATSTFVLDATLDQIRRIAALDGVKEIWPNDRAAEFDRPA